MSNGVGERRDEVGEAGAGSRMDRSQDLSVRKLGEQRSRDAAAQLCFDWLVHVARPCAGQGKHDDPRTPRALRFLHLVRPGGSSTLVELLDLRLVLLLHNVVEVLDHVRHLVVLRALRRTAGAAPARNNSSSEIDEMELDGTMSSLDDLPDTPPRPSHSQLDKRLRQSHFSQLPQLSLDLSSSAMRYPGLRNSQPPTPASSGFNYQNNPTVSSVNTPTLSAQPMSRSQSFTPVTSGPCTPLGNDESDSPLRNSVQIETMNQKLAPISYPYSYGTENIGNGYCIDEPAKRLYNPNGFSNQRLNHLAQISQNCGNLYHNEPLLQAQHSIALVHPHSNSMMITTEEHKPFRCPVIGCEKAYKNQNGLKYHKTHGHSTQQIHDNGDGTYSILNPETSLPFPGTLGMEKEKPYKCDCCTKRYKNLNGLKYHKQHTPSCNPEFNLENMSSTGIGPLSMDASALCILSQPGVL